MRKFNFNKVVGWNVYRAISEIEKHGYVWLHRKAYSEKGAIIDPFMKRDDPSQIKEIISFDSEVVSVR